MFSDNGAAHKAYYYVRNLQGDVISVHDEHYTKVAEYAYDAYGNCTVTNQTDATFAKYNPIRYRGYYYNTRYESGYKNSFIRLEKNDTNTEFIKQFWDKPILTKEHTDLLNQSSANPQ